MEQFKKYGFKPLDNDQIKELVETNSRVVSHLQRYIGMGWTEILVEFNNKYALINVGGENSYTSRDNFNKYSQLNEQSNWYTLEEILNMAKSGSWIQITSKDYYDDSVVHHCIDHSPELNNRNPD